MKTQLLQEITYLNTLRGEGNKAAQLRKLIRQNFRVPKTWVIGTDLYTQYIAGINQKPALLSAFSQKLDLSKPYAVRSSSNFEDSSYLSFAGLFKTFLNVKGAEDIFNAVESIWKSAQSLEIDAYADHMDINMKELKMAVIIQELVEPIVSGVIFSHNPMTGAREIVIEAVQGEGPQLVQDGVTPERYIHKLGGWIVKPDKRSIPLNVIEDVLTNVQKIIKKFRCPLDLEWVFDGKDIYWVQIREITAINSPNVYSNRFSKDMMPGMIHPLIWSINIPLINTEWIGLLEEMVGKLGIKAEDLAKSFYYRSYFDMGTIGKVFNKVGFPSEGLEMMMGMLPQQKGRPVYRPGLKSILLVPRLVKFIYSKWFFEKRLIKDLPEIEVNLTNFSLDQIQLAAWQDVFSSVDRLYKIVQKSVYLNIHTPILASMLTRLLEKQLIKAGYKLSDLNLTQGLLEMEEYNPSYGLQMMSEVINQLGEVDKKLFEQNGLEFLRNNQSFCNLMQLFDPFVERFGHLSDNSNNFTAVPWREQPEMVLDMVRNYARNKTHQTPSLSFDEIKVMGLRKRILRFLFNRVRTYTFYREKVSRAYTYGYGLFRPHFLRLASVMQTKGWLEDTNQVFFLSLQEIKHAFQTDSGEDLIEKIEKRQSEMQSYENIKLPDVIYGDEVPPVFPTVVTQLEGTPTSSGYYTGPVKIIRSFADFSKVQQGDVVVIPYSDIGWMPIFSKAGAIIAESGGMLSHSSIIAREYKIPAVVSVSNALSLQDYQNVSVNGYTGMIVVVEADPSIEAIE